MSETVYIVSREKLIYFIENYLPDDALFELQVLYEIMHRFVTPSGDEAVPLIDGKVDPILNEETQKMVQKIDELGSPSMDDLYRQARIGKRR
jgi:hypothetical protein